MEQLLVNALISHTQSAQPAGLFLSGGVDSTLLLALSSHYNLKLPYVFSIVNQKYDKQFGTADYKYVRLAVQQYHPSAEIIEVDESLMDEIDDFIGKMDHPVADPAYLLTYKLSGLASQRTNVALSGAGADELFAGYNRHHAFYSYLKNYKRIMKGMPLIKGLNPYIPSTLPFLDRKRVVLLKKLLHKVEKDPWLTFDNFLSFEKLNPPLMQGNWDVYNPVDFFPRLLRLALERDRHEYLPEDVLTVNDRGGMLEGLEMRMPYLDHHITSYVLQIPDQMLFSNGQKWILKELLKKYGGERFCQRPKEGFGFPFGHWIRKPEHKNILKKLTSEKNLVFNFIEREEFLKLVRDHLSLKEDNSQEIWSFLILSNWIERNFN
jgi:asparagine synthase (glutamine-hydrolysing)